MQSLESLGSDGVWSGILGICQGCGVWGAACAGSKIPGIRVPVIQGCGLQGAACAECCGAGLWLFPVPRPGYPLVLLWGSHSGNSLPAAPTAAIARAGAGTAPGQVQPGWRRDFLFLLRFFTRRGHRRHCCGCALEGGAALESSWTGTRGAGIAPCSHSEVTVCLYNRAVIPVNKPCVLSKPLSLTAERFFTKNSSLGFPEGSEELRAQ